MNKIIMILIVFLLFTSTATATTGTRLAPNVILPSSYYSSDNWWGGTNGREMLESFPILYAGNVTNIWLGVGDSSKIDEFRVTVWRQNGTTYDRVAISEDISSQLVNGDNNIELATPLTVCAGDRYGYVFDTGGQTGIMLQTYGGNGRNVFYAPMSSVTETNFAWGSQSYISDRFTAMELYGDSGDDEQVSMVGPYDDVFTDAPNNLHGGTNGREFLTAGHNMRIRQNGNINSIMVSINDVSELAEFRLSVWRKDGSTYDRVSLSENIADDLSPGLNVVVFDTPIVASVGDFYGYVLDDGSQTTTLSRTASGTTYYVDASGVTGTNFAWESQSSVTGVVLIGMYMDHPDAVFIGDSIMAGHTAHYSFIETTDTTDIDSTIAYSWANLSGGTYQNMGIGGEEISNEILNRFYYDCVALNPTYAIIEGGVNDIRHGTATNQDVIDAYESCIIGCVNNDIIPVVVLILPGTALDDSECVRADAINSALVNLSGTYSDLIIADARDEVGQYSSSGPDGNYWDMQSVYNGGDGLHYNGDGHEVIGQVIYNAILAQGSQSSSPTIQLYTIQNGNPLTSVVVNDEDNTGGYMNEYGRRSVTPDYNSNKVYPVSLTANSLGDGFTVEITADGDDVTAVPLTINNLVASRNYDIYLDNQFIERIGEVNSYTYNFTSFSTHTLTVDYVDSSGSASDTQGSTTASGAISGTTPGSNENLPVEDKTVVVTLINPNWWKGILLVCLLGVVREGTRKEGNGFIIALGIIGIAASAYKLGFV